MTTLTRERARRAAIRTFSAAFALLVLIDVIPVYPSTASLQVQAKNLIDPLLDSTGLWQGEWNLFAPGVDSNNSRIEALVIYSDGSEAEWKSVDWTQMSPWGRLRVYRYLEFLDDLTRDSAACASFAGYLARSVPAPRGGEAKAVQVRVFEHVHEIPPPNPDAWVPVGPWPVEGGVRRRSCVWKDS